MTLGFKFLLSLVAVAALTLVAFGQTQTPSAAPTGPLLKSNPKISQPDFDAATAETLASGGEKAELVYAARIDAVTRGAYDSLIVIYAKPAKAGKDHFATILREGQKFPLVFDKKDKPGRALNPGDRFLQIGLRHEEGKSPLLRLMALTTDKEKGEQRRNLDFQFNGTEFAMLGQSTMPLPK
jgi:hypothetical protein